MDEPHLLAAARYIELNPVRAGLAKKAEDYQWSSARAHLAKKDDPLVRVGGLCGIVGNWKDYISEPEQESKIAALRRHLRSGRPCGGDGFVDELESKLGLYLRQRKRGPKKKPN